MSQYPKVGVIAVVWQRGKTLLVKRKNPPYANHWGFPGGKLEWGETLNEAAARELHEETDITAEMKGGFATFDVITQPSDEDPGHHYVMVAIGGEYISGEATPQDDALDARWFSPDQLPEPYCPSVPDVIAKSLKLRGQ